MVSRVMRAVGVDLVNCTSTADIHRWIDSTLIDLIVYDLEGMAADQSEALVQMVNASPNAPALVLLNAQMMGGSLSQMLDHGPCRNVIAKVAQEGTLDISELLLTTRKILDNDIFGVEKYLRWGCVLHSRSMTDSTQKNRVIGEFGGFLEELDCDPRVVNQLQLVADEFLMNGFYNAPVDESGGRPYAALSRTVPVALASERPLEFEYSSDGRVVAVACRDPFGSADPDRVLRSFSRALRAGKDQVNFDAGGAGIGLYMAYLNVDQLIVNVAPGRMTEFIGVVDVSQRIRDRSAKAKSLHFFTAR